MKQTRYTEAHIVDILAQAARGEMTAIEVCRINGISEQTFYRWKHRYRDLRVSEVRRLRELEAENARLKRSAPVRVGCDKRPRAGQPRVRGDAPSGRVRPVQSPGSSSEPAPTRAAGCSGRGRAKSSQ